MESLSVKHMISAAQSPFPWKYNTNTNPIHIRRFNTHFHRFRLVVYSKTWEFQDFQDYAKPTRLLPANKVEICEDFSLHKALTSLRTSDSRNSIYKVTIQTSKMYGSGLTNMNSGVLLCLIDNNGYSILQRIPAISVSSSSSSFQQGAINEFIFEGQSLGNITAVWIGIESGQWRLGGISLSVIHNLEDDKTTKQCIGFQYNFKTEDVLLGEGNDISMVELKPSSVSEFSEEDSEIILSETSSESSPLGNYTTNEESMEKYADLKFSLLLYDAMLIMAGSSVASLLAGENAGYAFFVGGFGGFLYLLLLQRSVDGLSSSELISKKNSGDSSNQVLGILSPVTVLGLAFGFAIIAAKYGSGATDKILTPQDLLCGTIGFLMCKVAVILAAFKPMPWFFRQEK